MLTNVNCFYHRNKLVPLIGNIRKFLGNMPFYYAVARGRKQGIYNSWDECKTQVDKFSAPIFKKFSSQSEAEEFIQKRGGKSSLQQDTSYPKYSVAPKQTPSSKTTSYPVASQKLSARSSKRSCLAASGVYALTPSNSNVRKQSSSVFKRSLSTDALDTQSNERSTKLSKTNDNEEDLTNFNVDSDGYVSVFTDGACSSNGGKSAKAGIGVWFGDNHPLNVSEAVIGRQTNNVAEIHAVTAAARQATRAGVKKLKINTDSQFIIQCISQWMKKWKATGWQTANGKNVINKNELIEMETALKSFEQVTWNHVPGHAGIHGNEMADKLARAGVTRCKE